MPILPTLPHRTLRALCGSVEKKTDSLVKRMTLCAQVGGGGEGGKGHGQNRSPRQSVVHLFFVVVSAKDFSDIFFLRAQKYWRETHQLDPLLQGPECDQRWIINMDQTPVFFSMHPKKMLEILGNKTIIIGISTSTNDTRHSTAALTITAAGDQLVPMVVYQGAENGTIKKRELQHHHPTCIHKTQTTRGWTRG